MHAGIAVEIRVGKRRLTLKNLKPGGEVVTTALSLGKYETWAGEVE